MNRWYKAVPAVLVAGMVLGACSEASQDPMGAQFKRTTPVQVCPNVDPLGLDIDLWTKIDASEDGASGAWGEFNYNNQFLAWDMEPGYTLHLCIKSGSQVGTVYPPGFTGEGEDLTIIAQDISHISWRVTYTPFFEDDPEWCSPGYWRQEHHLDSWPASVSPTTGFNDVEPLVDFYGEISGNPSLLTILRSPQVYGGAVRNLIATYLSMQGGFFLGDLEDGYPDGIEPHVCPLN